RQYSELSTPKGVAAANVAACGRGKCRDKSKEFNHGYCARNAWIPAAGRNVRFNASAYPEYLERERSRRQRRNPGKDPCKRPITGRIAIFATCRTRRHA